MQVLDLTKGFGDFTDYKLFKFPGGEVHFIIKDDFNLNDSIHIVTKVNNSDDLIALFLAVDTVRAYILKRFISVEFLYMPYQQADMKFDIREAFSLKTIIKLLNTLDVDMWVLNDPHSTVSPALFAKPVAARDNSIFIKKVLDNINSNNICLLSPDAGAYKKVAKLAAKLDFKGDVTSASKYRNTANGNIESIILPVNDFEGKDILIIDDICMGGRTFIELAKVLKTKNIGKLYLAISHMIFKKPNEELFKYFDVVYTTNSREDSYYAPEDKLKVIPI